jgi:nucleotidyltransferase/DNA polymerase involved in DNA repair
LVPPSVMRPPEWRRPPSRARGPAPEQDGALARMELADLWGVAGRLAARLAALGIATPHDLKRGDARLIRERLGVLRGVTQTIGYSGKT